MVSDHHWSSHVDTSCRSQYKVPACLTLYCNICDKTFSVSMHACLKTTYKHVWT